MIHAAFLTGMRNIAVVNRISRVRCKMFAFFSGKEPSPPSSAAS
jgi:hypothetical protein